MGLIPVNFGPADLSGLKTNDKHPLHFAPSPATISFLKPFQFPDRFTNCDGFRFRNLLENFKYQQTRFLVPFIIIESNTCVPLDEQLFSDFLTKASKSLEVDIMTLISTKEFINIKSHMHFNQTLSTPQILRHFFLGDPFQIAVTVRVVLIQGFN